MSGMDDADISRTAEARTVTKQTSRAGQAEVDAERSQSVSVDNTESIDPAVSITTDPALAGVAAIPPAAVAPATRTPRSRGRKRVDPNHGKDTNLMAIVQLGIVQRLDRRAEGAGVPAPDRLFLGRAVGQCTDDGERVRAIAGIVLTAFPSPDHATTPLSIHDARTSTGAIKDKAAVAVLGRWLLLEGAPGLATRRGKPMDRLAVLKVVAAVAHDAVRADRLREEFEPTVLERHLTDARIAAIFHRVIGENMTPGEARSLRRSATLALGDFLDHHRGGTSRRGLSPLLIDVLTALGPATATSSTTPISTPKVTGRMVAAARKPAHGFEIAARYSSVEQAAIYCAQSGAALDGPTVVYTAVGSGGRLAGRHTYAPDLAMSDFRVEALFDRLVLTFIVGRRVSFRVLRAAAEKATGRPVYVKEITAEQARVARSALPSPPAATTHGRYEITLQEPTPDMVKSALDAIEAICALVGAPEIVLLELSLDFSPDPSLGPSERLTAREKMVTVLHRHHYQWIDPTLQPKETERRQTYQAGETTQARPLIRHAKRSTLPVTLRDVSREEARSVILGTLPEEIVLNATVYDGTRLLGAEVSVQHKVTDQRKKKDNSYIVLLPEFRRARMEVILTDDTLRETYGIRFLSDLTGERLRTIKREHLSLLLPVLPDDPVAFAAQAERFARGGVYALDLYQRALAYQTKNRDGTGKHGRLVAWTTMNDLTGAAIDKLARKWKGFRWP